MIFFTQRNKSLSSIPESKSEKKLSTVKKRLTINRHSLYPESYKSSTSRKSLNPNPFSSVKSNKTGKIDLLMSKISNISDKNKNHSPPNVQQFKKNISRNIKSLIEIDLESAKEKKEVIEHYSTSIKSGMYSISCSGKKYREARLKKHLSAMHIRKIF